MEILVVVLIIGLLTTVLATNLLSRADDAKIQLAQTQIRQLEQQLEMYKLDNGRYPSEDQGLDALAHEPSGEPRPRHYPAGGYVKADSIIDPWDMPYQYRNPGQHNAHSFDLYSLGPEGVENSSSGNVEIANWESGSR